MIVRILAGLALIILCTLAIIIPTIAISNFMDDLHKK